jgi:hypothetical protein
MGTDKPEAKARRERFIAEAQDDFAEFNALTNIHQYLNDFILELNSAADDPVKSPPRRTISGGHFLETALHSSSDEAPTFRSATSRSRYRIDSSHFLEEKCRLLWSDFDERWEDYLSEVRMSGDGDGDVFLSAPVPPPGPRPLWKPSTTACRVAQAAPT